MIDNPFDPKFYPNYVPFDKRHVVFDFPTSQPLDSCVKFYSAWRPFIRGALAALMYRDMWEGSTEDVDVMVQEAGNLLDRFSDTTCETVTQYRIDPSDPCIIQSSDDGITWLPFFDARCGDTEPDLSIFIKKVPFANENVIQPTDTSIGLIIINELNHGLKSTSIGANPAILESLATDLGLHDFNLLLTSPTPRADRKGVIGVDIFGDVPVELVNWEGAIVLPEHTNVADGQDNTNRRGSLYRHLESSDLDGIYAAVQVTDGVVDFRRLAYTVELPEEGLDGAGITAVELNQIVPTATPYATLSTPSTIQDQLLSLGINRGIGVASVAAVGLDAGSDPDIESTPNTDGDLELTFGIPKGDKGDQGDQGDQGETGYPTIELPLDGQYFDYKMVVESYGTFFPINVPEHFSLQVLETYGIWANKSATFGLVPYPTTGSLDDTFDDLGLGLITFVPTWPDHRHENPVSAWDKLTSTDDSTAICMFQHNNLTDAITGQVLVTIRFMNNTGWEHEFDFLPGFDQLGWECDDCTDFSSDQGFYSDSAIGDEQVQVNIRLGLAELTLPYTITGCDVYVQGYIPGATEIFTSLEVIDSLTTGSAVMGNTVNVENAIQTWVTSNSVHEFTNQILVRVTMAPTTGSTIPTCSVGKIVLRGYGSDPF